MLPQLQARFPIERARMRLRLTFPLSVRDEIEALLTADKATSEESELVGEKGWECQEHHLAGLGIVYKATTIVLCPYQ